MAAGGRRPRPGGRLARPAPARLAAAGRPDRPRRAAAAADPLARCSPRSAGCSTSPAPGPASGWSSPPSQSPDDDGEQPSRFVHELGREPEHRDRAARAGRCRWPGWSPSCAAPSPTPTSPSRCGRPPPGGCGCSPRPRCTAARSPPSADPATWWGLRAPTRSERPVRPADEPLTLSASALDGLLTCPAQWFLAARGRGRGGQLDQPGLRQGRPRDRRADRVRRPRPPPTT